MIAGPIGTTYVDDAWIGFSNGTVIADADPATAGNQTAIFGANAFATVQGGIDAVATSGTVVVNAGTYTTASLANSKTLKLIGDATLNSLESSAGTTFDLELSTLTVGDATNKTIAGEITNVGGGSLIKQGAGN